MDCNKCTSGKTLKDCFSCDGESHYNVIGEESNTDKVKVAVNDVIRKIVTDAHMAGQGDAGVDPSYSNALSYCKDIFPAT